MWRSATAAALQKKKYAAFNNDAAKEKKSENEEGKNETNFNFFYRRPEKFRRLGVKKENREEKNEGNFNFFYRRKKKILLNLAGMDFIGKPQKHAPRLRKTTTRKKTIYTTCKKKNKQI